MPWRIVDSYNGVYVVNSNTGARMNKKPMTREQAKKYMAALYANIDTAEKVHSGAMVSLNVPPAAAAALSVIAQMVTMDPIEILPPEEMHITLAYLGKAADLSPDMVETISGVISQLTAKIAEEQDGQPITGEIQGIGRFNHTEDGLSALYFSYSSPFLAKYQSELMCMLEDAGVPNPSGHGFIPHITYAYVDENMYTAINPFPNIPIEFDCVYLCLAGNHIDFPIAPASAGATENEEEASETPAESAGEDETSESEPGVVTTKLESAYGDAMVAASQPPDKGNDDEEDKPKTTDTSEKGGFLVFKTTTGQSRWVLYSSNGFEDRDGECVSTASLEEDCARADEMAPVVGIWKAYGPLRMLHAGEVEFDREGDWTSVYAGEGLDLGICDFNVMIDGILVESGTFFDENVAEALAPVAKEYRGSIAFAKPPDNPDAEKVYHHIRRYERSLVPLRYALPSNRFTAFHVG